MSKTISPLSIMAIDREFKHLKDIQINALDKNIMAFLEKAQIFVQSEDIRDLRDPFKRSLIHYAAIGDCTELLLRLLDIGAPIDDRDQNRRTPLSWAAQYGSHNATRILVENGAQVNSLDDMYGTPLSWLKHAGHPDCKGLPVTKAYLKKNGAAMKGAKRAWILQKLRLL